MGWITHSISRGVGVIYYHNAAVVQPFADDPLVRFFINIEDHYICYIIKEFSEDQKQKTKNKYKFIKMEYSPNILEKGNGKPKFTIKEFGSNMELFGFIIRYKACNNEYKRHFNLNDLLK